MSGPSKEEIEKSMDKFRAHTPSDWNVMRDAYKEAVKALRDAMIEEEEYLEIYSGELDPEHRHVLREQIKKHNDICDKYPEEE